MRQLYYICVIFGYNCLCWNIEDVSRMSWWIFYFALFISDLIENLYVFLIKIRKKGITFSSKSFDKLKLTNGFELIKNYSIREDNKSRMESFIRRRINLCIIRPPPFYLFLFDFDQQVFNFNRSTVYFKHNVTKAGETLFKVSANRKYLANRNNARGWKNIYARGTLADRKASRRNLIQERNVGLERLSSIRLRENGEDERTHR